MENKVGLSINTKASLLGKGEQLGTPGGKSTPVAKLKNFLSKVKSQEIDLSSLSGESPQGTPTNQKKKTENEDKFEADPATAVQHNHAAPSNRSLLKEKSAIDMMGKAKSVGFNSFKAGLSRKEYEELILKSPVKPISKLILSPVPANNAPGHHGPDGSGIRRAVSINKLGQSLTLSSTGHHNGVVLPPLSQSNSLTSSPRSKGNDYQGLTSDGLNSLSSIQSNNIEGESQFSPLGRNDPGETDSIDDDNTTLPKKKRRKSQNRGDDEYGEEFDTRTQDSYDGENEYGEFDGPEERQRKRLERMQVAEERAAKTANDNNSPSLIADYVLNELQSEDLIDRRFGWNKGDRASLLEASNRILNIHNPHDASNKSESSAAADDFLSNSGIPTGSPSQQSRSPVKLGEITPSSSMKQSIRSSIGRTSASKGNRKGTVGNIPANVAAAVTSGSLPSGGTHGTGPGSVHLPPPAGAGVVTPNPNANLDESVEVILDSYSGLLFKDPLLHHTWKDLNMPKKMKTGLFAAPKQSLSAGRNINAYRPWGPPRPVDPLDMILEKTIANAASVDSIDVQESGSMEKMNDTNNGKQGKGKRATFKPINNGKNGKLAQQQSNRSMKAAADLGGSFNNRIHSPLQTSPPASAGGTRPRTRSPSQSGTGSGRNSARIRTTSRSTSPHEHKSGRSENSRSGSPTLMQRSIESRGRSRQKTSSAGGDGYSDFEDDFMEEDGTEIVVSAMYDNSVSTPNPNAGRSQEVEGPAIEGFDSSRDKSSGKLQTSTPPLSPQRGGSPSMNMSTTSPTLSMSSTATKKRSPLIINYIKPPLTSHINT